MDGLLSGAQQQHYFSSGHANKEMSLEYNDGLVNDIQDRSQFEADKQSVYKHPLFPLLALMLEKCEEATRGEADTQTVLSSLENDVQVFIQHEKDGNKMLTTDDVEVDELMLKALQVLRIHLLELEKVQELCRDFCCRYIACLRSKLHSENLLRTDGEGSAVDGDEAGYDSNGSNASGGNHFNLDAVSASYSTNCRKEERLPHSSHSSQVSFPQPSLSSEEDEENNPNSAPGNKVKRGVLPRKATAVLRSWLFQHLVHPYPTEDEKRQLAAQTKLTLLQVNNWFINARRRILQPMLDSAHSAHSGPTSLKSDEFPSKRILVTATSSGSGPGSDGEDALSFGDSDQ